jgi:CheY-like chemotaxis protein
MTRRMKSVMVIEDEKGLREVLEQTLGQYGFNPICGETVARTLELLYKHKDDVAVIIIDMELSQFADYREYAAKEAAAVTGTGLAKRLLSESRVRRPEIIILSAFGTLIEYYKEAIEAGASEYLVKGLPEDRERFVPYVQALALKSSFQSNSANEVELARLAEGHANRFELLDYFCRNTLTAQLDLCLTPASYVLLLREEDERGEDVAARGSHVFVYSDAGGLPAADDFDYVGLHRAVFEQTSRLATYAPRAESQTAGGLSEFSFIQLAKVTGAEIALGILNPFPVKDAVGHYPFSQPSLLEALVKHASPALETFVEKLIFRWQERQAVKLERVRTLASLSGAVQRRLSALLGAQPPGLGARAAERYEHLKQLSRELADYSHSLSTLLESAAEPTAAAGDGATRLSEVVQDIRTEYDRRGHFDEVSFSVETDGLVPAERYFFSLALRELTRWAVERWAEAASGARLLIEAGCAAKGDWMEVYFRENGERLPQRARQGYLFEPMSPLHVAQLIVEVACQGSLIDATDELGFAEGHQFKIMLLQR